MTDIVLIAHDIRSTHNVGALLRTAECMGVSHIYFTGYTPYPEAPHDERLPHERRKLSSQIDKTALGAAKLVDWSHETDIDELLARIKEQGCVVAALEQTKDSLSLPSWQPPTRVALIIGREVEGIDPSLLAQCDVTLEIPQFGKKESLNVIQATAMALYHMRFAPKP